MRKIKHYHQPTGISCGPTCIYMALRYAVNKHNDLPFSVDIKYSIEDVTKLCGTDSIVGTPPDRMEKGMKALNMNYVEYIHSPKPYELLRDILDSENVPMLRTITKGIPHWIIIESCTNNLNKYIYNVLDPWQGEIQYNEEQLDEVWSPRFYQFFEVLTRNLIQHED
jgi:ABC-type bacteriocin/lantibiotic exporter with double-glycine peptidase domain